MNRLFQTILNMSLTGAFVIAAVCLARLPLKKAPRIISYSLWAVVGFRLLFPFSIESDYSLMPFEPEAVMSSIAARSNASEVYGYTRDGSTAEAGDASDIGGQPGQPPLDFVGLGGIIWPIGVASMLAYGFVSYALLKRRIKGAAPAEAGIFEAMTIASPFVLGVARPRIYLPVGLSEAERRCVIQHEKTHIRRLDHIVKLAAYALLCLHWFNPLAWLAFLLMGVDMEMSCDERVLKEMGGRMSAVGAAQREYSMSLLSLATKRRFVGSSPLAFSEGGIKDRIKNVLNFRKRSRLIVIAAVVLVAALSVGFTLSKVSGAESATEAGDGQLIEMHVVYEENPASFFREMKLIWGDTVYHSVPVSDTERGREIGYATDEYSTWRIYELEGHGRDNLLAVESEDVWRVMSSQEPQKPWRQYILENATEKQRAERMLSVTLCGDGTAQLATPPISSYMLPRCTYSIKDGELLIYAVIGDEHEREFFGLSDRSIVARFQVLDENTIIFRSASVPVFAVSGTRYVTFGSGVEPVAEPVAEPSDVVNKETVCVSLVESSSDPRSFYSLEITDPDITGKFFSAFEPHKDNTRAVLPDDEYIWEIFNKTDGFTRFEIVLTYDYGCIEGIGVYYDTSLGKAYYARNSSMFELEADVYCFIDSLFPVASGAGAGGG